MRAFFLYFVFLFCITSCESEEKPPADLMPKDKFTEVLVDVRLLEGAYASRFSRVDAAEFKIDSYYLTLFQKHGVDKQQFLDAYSYYTSRPKEMEAIEGIVMERLSALQATQEQLNAELKTFQADSLKRDSTKIDSLAQKPAIQKKKP